MRRVARAGFVALGLLAAACGHRKAEEPQPQVPSATYAEGNAAPMPIDLPAAAFITVANSYPGNQARRAVTLQVALPDGRKFEYVYSFYASTFPTATGPVPLDLTVQIAPVNAAGVVPPYNQDVSSTGRLTVDSLTPRVVSGTYTGVLVYGGPVVRLTFNRLPVN